MKKYANQAHNIPHYTFFKTRISSQENLLVFSHKKKHLQGIKKLFVTENKKQKTMIISKGVSDDISEQKLILSRFFF